MGGDCNSCCTGRGVIRSNWFIFMLGSCTCVVGSGSDVHSFCGGSSLFHQNHYKHNQIYGHLHHLTMALQVMVAIVAFVCL